MWSVMYCGGEHKQWSYGKAGTVDLQKVNRMLKPDKWRAIFDSEGKAFGFKKALKLIVLEGIDPSIRPEVWEFLLGCYALGSTTEYRRSLRAARRERYGDLIKECQSMHSSIGTGSLAFVGSKVMDMRTSSNVDQKMETKIEKSTSTDDNIEIGKCCNRGINCIEVANASHQESSNDRGDLVSLRANTDNATYDSPSPRSCRSPNFGREADGSCYVTDSCSDFPPLPVANLIEKSVKDKKSRKKRGNKLSAQHRLRLENDRMHSFQISNNVDLVIESSGQQPLAALLPIDCEIEIASLDEDVPELLSNKTVNEVQMVNQQRILDVQQQAMINTSISQGKTVIEDRVSEWLCTLHRIVVDVVRTDSHLEFYEDARNLARMSDILAVYAWVDPATGYCQGMSDLLSPFVVLFEDNADAFWCFEMLLRRMRENFQMEGPTGVMKQLQALWHILELTDREMFAHLSNIGAESLHFAFPMLLVLFRRELSFDEALSMWEMMWAADFDESLAYDLKEKCLEALVVHLPRDAGDEMREGNADTDDGSVKSGSKLNQNENNSKKGGLQSNHVNVDHSVCDVKMKLQSPHSFCGLIRIFWPRNGCVQMSTVASVTRKGNDELPIFCVAAILVINRQKIIRQTHSFEDMIKMFNDKMLKINVKRCIRMAIKLRKKYFYKIIKRKIHVAQNGTRVTRLSTYCCGKRAEWH